MFSFPTLCVGTQAQDAPRRTDGYAEHPCEGLKPLQGSGLFKKWSAKIHFCHLRATLLVHLVVVTIGCDLLQPRQGLTIIAHRFSGGYLESGYYEFREGRLKSKAIFESVSNGQMKDQPTTISESDA